MFYSSNTVTLNLLLKLLCACNGYLVWDARYVACVSGTTDLAYMAIARRGCIKNFFSVDYCHMAEIYVCNIIIHLHSSVIDNYCLLFCGRIMLSVGATSLPFSVKTVCGK